MSSSNPVSRDFEAEASDDELEYRPISVLAVAGLLLGLLSALAFIHPLLWLFPLLGAVLSGWALARLDAPGSLLVGRKAALVGLTVSLSLSVAAPGRWAVQRWQFKAETRRIAKDWFLTLREGKPYAAHQFTLHPWQRFDDPDEQAARYAEPDMRREIEEYVLKPPVQTLLSIGKYAAVRYVKNESYLESSGEANITNLYAVSVRDRGEISSFFVLLAWVRVFDHTHGGWGWRLSSASFVRELPPDLFSPA